MMRYILLFSIITTSTIPLIGMEGKEETGTSKKHVDVDALARETKRSKKDVQTLLSWNFTEDDIRGMQIRNIQDPVSDVNNLKLYRDRLRGPGWERRGETDISILFDPDNEDFLRRYTEADYLVLLPYLVSNTADLNNNDLRQRTVFSRAMITRRRWDRVAALLIGISDWDPNLADQGFDRDTPLHTSITSPNRAGEYGFPQLVVLLITRPELNVNPVDEEGFTPLHRAVLLSEIENVALLLAHPHIEVTQKVKKPSGYQPTVHEGKTPIELVEFIKNEEARERIRVLITTKLKASEAEAQQFERVAVFDTVSKPFIVPGIPNDIINKYRQQYEKEKNRPLWQKPFAWAYKNPTDAGLFAVAAGLLGYIITPASKPGNLTSDELARKLETLLDGSRLIEAYELADTNKTAREHLSQEQRKSLLLKLHEVRGLVIQTHKAAATALPGVRHYQQWRLGNEAKQLKLLADLSRLIQQ